MPKMIASITMLPATLESLTASGYTLDAFQAVKTNDDSTMPTVWMSAKNYSTNTTLTWSDQVKAYTSSTPIDVGNTIAVGFSVDIAPGQKLTVSKTGTGTTTTAGIPGALSVLNTSGQDFTVGVTASGTVQGVAQSAAPLFAVALTGSDLKLIELTRKVLFVVSGSNAVPGAVVTQSLGPGVMVDFASAPDGERSLSFDRDSGWSWGDAVWADAVPPGANLKSLLTVRSERLVATAKALLIRLLAL